MTARQAINLLVSAIQGVLPGGTTVGMGWPTMTQLQDVAASRQGPIVNVYDKGPSANSTRWMPFLTNTTTIETELTSTLSTSTLVEGGIVTLTLGGTIQQNDAVALACVQERKTAGVTSVAGPTDTLTTLASSLANAINHDPTLSTQMHAVASGPVITITGANPLVTCILSTLTCNIVNANVEGRRTKRTLQIVCWTNTAEVRETLSEPIAGLITQTQANFGFQDPVTQQFVRLISAGDVYSDDPVLTDLYVRALFVTMDYGETYAETLYPVLIAQCALQPPQ